VFSGCEGREARPASGEKGKRGGDHDSDRNRHQDRWIEAIRSSPVVAVDNVPVHDTPPVPWGPLCNAAVDRKFHIDDELTAAWTIFSRGRVIIQSVEFGAMNLER
jgi:hypothetical protein